MKIRIMGLPGEIEQAVQAICDTDKLDVIEISGPYANRGNSRMLRLYIEVRASGQQQELPS